MNDWWAHHPQFLRFKHIFVAPKVSIYGEEHDAGESGIAEDCTSSDVPQTGASLALFLLDHSYLLLPLDHQSRLGLHMPSQVSLLLEFCI